VRILSIPRQLKAIFLRARKYLLILYIGLTFVNFNYRRDLFTQKNKNIQTAVEALENLNLSITKEDFFSEENKQSTLEGNKNIFENRKLHSNSHQLKGLAFKESFKDNLSNNSTAKIKSKIQSTLKPNLKIFVQETNSTPLRKIHLF